MVKCCVVGYISGYKSNPENITWNCVPKDAKRCELWAEAVRRKDLILNDKRFARIKHFNDKYVIRFWLG